MTDQDLVIELEPDDTQGHAALRVTDDDGWLKERLGRDPGGTRISLKASDDDVEGHVGGSAVALRAFEGDDDTEGHAISVHFPSRAEADAFRRRLMLTGVLAGTIAVGGAAGIGLANLADSPGAASGAAVTTQAGPMDAHEAPAFQAAAGAATQAGPLDAHEAPAFQAAAGAATQAGPLDAHEAPAFQEGAGAATQAGPLDAHEAPAFQEGAGAATEAGPLDAHEAPAFQEPANLESDKGGPAPR